MRERLVVVLISCSIFILFFYKVLLAQVPFPGDLLLSRYEPYRSYSYDGYTPGSIPTKNQGADVVRELYPWKYLSIEQLKGGAFPFWNPNNFSGNPQFANLQSGVFNPVNILFFILNFNTGWAFYIVFQYILLFYFTYLYLRTIKIGYLGSLFGAIAFSFSGFLVVWGEYGNFGYALCYLPLVLLSVEKLLSEGKMRWGFLVSLALVLSIFSGYIQISLYIFIFALIYAGLRVYSLKQKGTDFLRAAVFLIAPLFVAALQIVPLYEFVSLSLRSSYTFPELSQRLNSPFNLITLLVPDFFGNPATSNYFIDGSILERAAFIGVWPLVFSLYGIFSNKSFHARFFGIGAVIIYISTLAILPIIFLHSIGIPFLSTGVPTRILCIFTFFAAVLGAIGVDAFQKNKNRLLLIKVIGVIGIVFAALVISTFVGVNANSLISRRNLIIPLASFIIGVLILLSATFISVKLFKSISKKSALIFALSIILLLTAFELYYSFSKFNSFVKQSYIYPDTPVTSKIRQIQGIDRYWGYGSAEIDPNLQIMQKNYSPLGYDALYLKRYGQFINGSKSGKLEEKIEHTQGLIAQGFGSSDLKNNPSRQRALNLLGVRYVLNKNTSSEIDSAFDEKNYKLIWHKDGFQIYQNLEAFPRISAFGGYTIERNPKRAIAKIYDEKFDFKNSLVLEEKPSGFNFKKGNSKISDIKYFPNKISFKSQTDSDSLIFISDNFYPGWQASIDGNKTRIYIADYTFRAIPIHAGTHSVKLYFSSESFQLGSMVSAVAVLLLTLYGFMIIRRHEL